ncbi:MAG: hypothetical protein K6F79_01705 [Saccharofermentans sp.]|nr:hypothetical protein [Saccharofermentans sp.]
MLESGQVIRRELTSEEIQILLDHPECVMFDHWKAMKTHKFSLLQALIPAALSLLLIVAFILMFPQFAEAHGNLTVAVSMILFFISIAAVPLIYIKTDDRNLNKAKENHYKDQLKELLPSKLKMKLFVVDWMVVEKGEGGYYDEDGNEQWFGYVGCGNFFPINKGDELVIIYEEEYKKDQFFGLVKKDPATMSLYDSSRS